MIPAAFHAPPRESGASASGTGAPPLNATFMSFPPAKYPIDFPSGDQNGWRAPSVPGIATASRDDSSRVNSRRPEAAAPTNTRRAWSGETTGADSSDTPSGSVHVNCAGVPDTGVDTADGRSHHMVPARRATRASAAATILEEIERAGDGTRTSR